MPFPAKTDRATVLAAALAQIAQGGSQPISLRSIAGTLGLAPNALYRYFRDRAALISAVAAAITDHLHTALSAAAEGKEPVPALRALALTYVRFAREQPRLYEMFMQEYEVTPEAVTAHERLWRLVVIEVARLCGPESAPEAAVALWAFLHGFAALEALCALKGTEPTPALEYGIQAMAPSRYGNEVVAPEPPGVVASPPPPPHPTIAGLRTCSSSWLYFSLR